MALLESEEAARQLGIKLATLYAYVSRGIIESHRSPDGRRSLFELEDVQRLALHARQAKQIETRIATINTSITQIGEHGPLYRGQQATELAAHSNFEDTAELLWQGEVSPWQAVELGALDVSEDRDRIKLVTLLVGAADSFRGDHRKESVLRAARTVITTAARHTGNTKVAEGPSIAATLSRRAGTLTIDENLVNAINAALILLADHELAPSTLAVRIAANTQADFYDAILSGLGVSGPRHLGASAFAHDFLLSAHQNGADRTIDEALRWHQSPPGFGHAVYRDTDPRLTALIPFIERLGDGEIGAILGSVLEIARSQNLPVPNIDLGLGALTLAVGSRRDFGSTLFSIARIAGWTAHYLEELQEPPGRRFRTRAVYVAVPR